MDQSRINEKMHQLEKVIDYKFKDLSFLANAMKSVLLEKQGGKSNREYSNDALAFLGDTIIKHLIAKVLYDQSKRKGEMTTEKAELEKNTVFHTIVKDTHISAYAYNDEYFPEDNPPEHKKVRDEKHDPYIEAIAAAIFLDGEWDAVGKWFESWLLPRLKQYKPQSNTSENHPQGETAL